ncbi:MAG: hypothetical protein RBS43_02130 [Candidatus Cloacimonas sp.]|jgi:hypothetical protein|nr:hypothetical protein [Candidatus Cloacimonas sp.]
MLTSQLVFFVKKYNPDCGNGQWIFVWACWSVGVLECWSVGVLECWGDGELVGFGAFGVFGGEYKKGETLFGLGLEYAKERI